PWRMGATIDNTVTTFNGQWQEVRILLKSLVEKGAWDEIWYEPQGLFDWTNIDRLEIVPEHQPLTGVSICYDDIKIEGEDIEEVITSLPKEDHFGVRVFPNPFTDALTIEYNTSENSYHDIVITNQLGVQIKRISN